MGTKTSDKLYTYLNDNKNEDIFKISTKKQLAEEVGMSVRSVTNALKLLEEEQKIALVTKRGAKGGVVITVIRYDYVPEELQEFIDSGDNIVTSSLKYAQKLKEEFFPSYTYARRAKPRRTKVEMAEYNAVKNAIDKAHMDMNLMLNHSAYPDRELFELAPDPEGYYRTYLLAKLYDQYKFAQFHYLYQNHEAQANDTDLEEYQRARHKKLSEFYFEQTKIARGYTIIERDSFFGSKRFTTLYNFYNEVKDFKNFNIFKYMQNVFNNVTFVFENSRSSHYYPALNVFISEKYIDNYAKYISRIEQTFSKTHRAISDGQDVLDTSVFTSQPIIVMLQTLYEEGLYTKGYKDEIDIMFSLGIDEGSADMGFFENEKHEVLYNYYHIIYEKLSRIGDEKFKPLEAYVQQLILHEYNPDAFSPITHMALFPMHRQHYINKLKCEDKRMEDYLPNIAMMKDDMSREDYSDYLWNKITEVGKAFAFYHRTPSSYYVIRMYSDYMGYQVNIRDIEHILKENDLEGLIPLTTYGTLDYDKVKEIEASL